MKCFWPSFKILNGMRGLCYMCCKFIVVYCVMIYIGFMLNFTDFAAGSRRCGVQHCCPMTSLKPEDAFDPNQVKWWWIVVVMRFNFLGQWFHIKIEYIHSNVPRCSLLLFNTILIFWSGFSKVNPEFPYLLHFRFQVLYLFFFPPKNTNLKEEAFFLSWLQSCVTHVLYIQWNFHCCFILGPEIYPGLQLTSFN